MTLDANWTTSEGKGKLTRRAFNQVRTTCEERTKGAYRTMPSGIAIDLVKYERVRRSLRQLIHDEVTALITLYANHTVNGGVFEGLASIPQWTESDILTAIGDAERLPVPNDHLNAAAWNYQTLKILTKLQWSMPPTAWSIFSVGRYDRTGSGASLAAAITDAHAKAWTLQSPTGLWCFAIQQIGLNYTEGKTVYTFPDLGSQYTYDIFDSARPSDMGENYFRINDVPPVASNPPGTDPRNKFWKLKSNATESISFSSQSVINNTFEPIEVVNRVVSPSGFAKTDWVVVPKIIFKFDGPNGFQNNLP